MARISIEIDLPDNWVDLVIDRMKEGGTVQPVVHGQWVGYPDCLKYPNAYSNDHIVCSACEECFSVLDNCVERFDYCPHCGAKMDLEDGL